MLRQTEFKRIRALRLPSKFVLDQREMAAYERIKLVIIRLWLENLILYLDGGSLAIACKNGRFSSLIAAGGPPKRRGSRKNGGFRRVRLRYPFSSLEKQGETESPLLISGSWSLVCSRGPCIPCESSGHFSGREAMTPESVPLYGATNPI